MKKCIALTAYNRSNYLTRCLRALKGTVAHPGAGEWELVVGVEPDNANIARLVRAVDFMPVHISVNETRLGVSENQRQTIDRAFEEVGADAVLLLTDDVVLSPDALRLGSWWLDQERRETDLALWMFNVDSDLSQPADLLRSHGEAWNAFRSTDPRLMTACRWNTGPCLFDRAGWNGYLHPWWGTDSRGFDWAWGERLAEHPRLTGAIPVASRAIDIGEHGVYCTPDLHRAIFEGVQIMDSPFTGEYRIIEPIEDPVEEPVSATADAASLSDNARQILEVIEALAGTEMEPPYMLDQIAERLGVEARTLARRANAFRESERAALIARGVVL